MLTRRTFLAGSAAFGAAVAGMRPWARAAALAAEGEGQATSAPGEVLGTLPFLGEGEVAFGVLTGRGLGGRRHLDLSDLDPDHLITPADRFMVRTRRPEYLEGAGPHLAVRSLSTSPIELSAAELAALAEPMGVHLLECTDNGRDNGFGLASAADWTGVSLARLFERTGRPAEVPWLLLVEGFDRHAGDPAGSVAGASWVFSPDDLARSKAFLATGMNGAPLGPDHGHPLRLVVPGWYGCAWIKWVTNLVFVPEDALPTAQMREFAVRLGQPRRAKRARDFGPATVEHAALPVRVEKLRVEGALAYRVVGLLWGGAEPAEGLAIRFRAEEPWVPVEGFTGQPGPATWCLWSHTWRPAAAGRYAIELKVEPSHLPARRLAAGHYRRTVEALEV
jgi:DMSO/TMAO reductase YedYZ molybdopterin-dependent catalytic subunit